MITRTHYLTVNKLSQDETIRSVKHEISGYEINKVSLSCFDDERYTQENGVDSDAYGHRAIL